MATRKQIQVAKSLGIIVTDSIYEDSKYYMVLVPKELFLKVLEKYEDWKFFGTRASSDNLPYSEWHKKKEYFKFEFSNPNWFYEFNEMAEKCGIIQIK